MVKDKKGFRDFIYFKCGATHSPTEIYHIVGNSIYEGNKLVVSFSDSDLIELNTTMQGILSFYQQGEKLPYYKFPKTMEKDLTVKGVLYCPFHAQIWKDKQDVYTEQIYLKFIDMFRRGIGGVKSITP